DHIPDVASLPLPAGGVGGTDAVWMGTRLRPLGPPARPAGGLAAYRLRHGTAGGPATRGGPPPRPGGAAPRGGGPHPRLGPVAPARGPCVGLGFFRGCYGGGVVSPTKGGPSLLFGRTRGPPRREAPAPGGGGGGFAG